MLFSRVYDEPPAPEFVLSRRSRGLLLLLLVLTLGAGVAGIWHSAQAIGAPYGGFMYVVDINTGPMVALQMYPDAPAFSTGIKPYDLVESVNGQSPFAIDTIYATLPIGTPITYTLIRNTSVRSSLAASSDGYEHLTVVVPTSRYTFADWLVAYGLLMVAGVAGLLATITILRIEQTPPVRVTCVFGWVGTMMCFMHGFSGWVNVVRDYPLLAAFFWVPANALLGLLVGHFALLYPYPLQHRWVKWWYVSGVVLIIPTMLVYILNDHSRLGQRIVELSPHHFYGVIGLVAAPGRIFGSVLYRRWQQGDYRVPGSFGFVWLVALPIVVLVNLTTTLRVRLPFVPVVVMIGLFPGAAVFLFNQKRLLEQQTRLLDEMRNITATYAAEVAAMGNAIHDGPKAYTTGLRSSFDALEQQLKRLPTLSAEVATTLHQCALLVETTDKALREAVDVLHAVPQPMATSTVHVPFLEQLQHTIAVLKPAQVTVDLDINLQSTADVPLHLQEPVLRVVREAMTNIAKHAHATTIRIEVRYTDVSFTLAVQDNGEGMRVAQRITSDHVPRGMRSMRQLAERLGGICTFVALNPGTRVEFVVPIQGRQQR